MQPGDSGGKCRATCCFQDTCCPPGAGPSPTVPKRCKKGRDILNFSPQPLKHTTHTSLARARCHDSGCEFFFAPMLCSCPHPQSLLRIRSAPRPSPASMAGSAPVHAGCATLGLEPGSTPLGGPRQLGFPGARRTASRLIIDRLVCPRLCQHVAPSRPGARTQEPRLRPPGLGKFALRRIPEGRIRSVEP